MASSAEVKLLGSWQSPLALRARIALNIKSIAYEFQQEDVLANKSDLLLQSNPVYKRIPVLIHNGRPICESLIIIEYIDQVWASGPALLPSDPYDRATARFWSAYIDQTWFQHLNANMVAERGDAKRAEEETTKGLAVLEDALAKCSKGGKFFGGENIGYLDIALGCFLPLIALIDKRCNISLIDQSITPNLSKWAHKFSVDPAVKDVLPHTDELYKLLSF